MLLSTTVNTNFKYGLNEIKNENKCIRNLTIRTGQAKQVISSFFLLTSYHGFNLVFKIFLLVLGALFPPETRE